LTTTGHGLAPIEAHQALFYSGDDEYLGGISDFVDPALDRGEPVAIAVPAPKHPLLRDELGDRATEIELLDMLDLGRNPARIIPVVRSMIERYGGALSYVGEPVWPGRSPEEIREATRHEALINLAWPDADIRVLCPYDIDRLDDEVLVDAEHTHPGVVRDRALAASSVYDQGRPPVGCDVPLPGPPPGAEAQDFEIDDLGRLRTWVAEHAAASGLDLDRIPGLVTAVNELTSNTVKHAAPHGTLRFWTAPGELVFEVEDEGHIADPLAGRRQRTMGIGGLGLWMVNQLCDLVEVRTSTAGTTIRTHSRL
jgi:anti-sigma regulatory factor (Ser/Thr protein kinase)